MYQVAKKLKKLKLALRRPNSKNFRNIVMKVEEDREDLKVIQQQIQEDPLNVDL